MGPLYELCATVYVLGGEVPAECEYRPSGLIRGREDIADECEWTLTMFDEGEASIADFEYWARVLNRAADLTTEDDRY